MASDGEHMVFHNTSESHDVVHDKKDALTTTEILSSEDIIIKKLPDQGNRYQYEHKFNIKRVYRKAIIGPRLSQLTAETNTLIKVPLPETELVMILGMNKESIKYTRYQIDEMVKLLKGKLPFTHFISIPTNTTDIKKIFNKFKYYALNCCDARGLKEGMFVKPETLHLTLTMISAVEDCEKEKSLDAFNTCEKEIINSIISESGPITIELRGVKCMNSNPAKAKVLYIEVHEETGYLEKITDTIFNYFLQQGLTRREYNKKLFHLTIINTKKLMDETQLFNNHTFDARDLLQTYDNAFFGKVELSNLHLSELGPRAEDGYYKAIAILDVTQFQNQKDNNINI